MLNNERKNHPKTAIADCPIMDLGPENFRQKISTYSDNALNDLLRSYRTLAGLSGALTGIGTIMPFLSVAFIKTYPYHVEDFLFVSAVATLGAVGGAWGVYLGSASCDAERILIERKNHKIRF